MRRVSHTSEKHIIVTKSLPLSLVQSIFVDGRMQFLSPVVFEFQIDRHLLPGEIFKIMLHLKCPGLWVPENSDTLSSDKWLWYGIDRPTRK